MGQHVSSTHLSIVGFVDAFLSNPSHVPLYAPFKFDHMRDVIVAQNNLWSFFVSFHLEMYMLCFSFYFESVLANSISNPVTLPCRLGCFVTAV